MLFEYLIKGLKINYLSSELFPHKSNPKVSDYEYDFAMDLLDKIGKKKKLIIKSYIFI